MSFPTASQCNITRLHERPNGEADYLTKGDNNHVDDRGLYAAGQTYINREHVIGRAKGYLPYIGMVTIIMNDYPIVKYILVGLMGLFVLVALSLRNPSQSGNQHNVGRMDWPGDTAVGRRTVEEAPS